MDRDNHRRREEKHDDGQFRHPKIKQEPSDYDRKSGRKELDERNRPRRTHDPSDRRSSSNHEGHSDRRRNSSNYEDHSRTRIKEEPRDDNDRRRNGRSRSRSPRTNHRAARNKREEEEAAKFQYGQKVKEETEDEELVEKHKPNFGLSGKLTEEKNIFNGVVVKYSEPPEARIPKRRWRFYVFKGQESLPTLYIHRQSAYLLGRDRKVADIPVDHPSCSKQHAVLQFRLVNYEKADGSNGRTVRPYIIDLEAANGTWVNGSRIEPKRYVELVEKDIIKFGFSSREYVLLHEESKTDAEIDDMGQE